MIESNKMHLSVADADDIEEIRDERISVADVVQSLVQHPAQIITRWNWKSAVMGAALRASFYFTVYKASRENWYVTLTAVMVEFCFRLLTSGVSGALAQSFRKATPIWLATVMVIIMLPTFSHTVEYVSHYAQENWFSSIFAASENNARQKAFAVSVTFSVISALFNLFIMRHGVLLVGAGEETKSFWSDLRHIPYLIVKFIVILPKEILRFMSEGKFLNSAGIFLSFGLAVGGLLGIFRGRWAWAWTTALGAWAVLFVLTLIFAVYLKLRQQKNLSR